MSSSHLGRPGFGSQEHGEGAPSVPLVRLCLAGLGATRPPGTARTPPESINVPLEGMRDFCALGDYQGHLQHVGYQALPPVRRLSGPLRAGVRGRDGNPGDAAPLRLAAPVPPPPPPGALGPPQAPVPPGGARPRGGLAFPPHPTPAHPTAVPGGPAAEPLRCPCGRGGGGERRTGGAGGLRVPAERCPPAPAHLGDAAAGGAIAGRGGGRPCPVRRRRGWRGAGLRRELLPPRVPRRSARRRRRRRAAPAACQRLRVPAHPRSLPGTSRLPPPQTAGSPRPGPPCPLTPALLPPPGAGGRPRHGPARPGGAAAARAHRPPAPGTDRRARRAVPGWESPAGARPRWGYTPRHPRPGGCSAPRHPRLGRGAAPRGTERLSLASLSEIGARWSEPSFCSDYLK